MAHYVIILAAGNSIRVKKEKEPKQFLELNNLPIIAHSMNAFANYDPNIKMYIGLGKTQLEKWNSICAQKKINIKHRVFVGGNERINTVYMGLKAIAKNHKINPFDFVSIHDAARPLISIEFISELIKNTKKYGNAIPVIKLKNSLKYHNEHVNRDEYRLVQTPQCFHFKLIYDAYAALFNSPKILKNILSYHDESSIYELFLDK